jgi:hypothetical protein
VVPARESAALPSTPRRHTPRGDRGQPKHREDHEHVKRLWQLATGMRTVAVQELLLIGKSSASKVFAENAASPAGSARHVIRHAEIAEVGQRIADGRQLPIEHRHHPRLGRVQQHVAQSIVAVGDARRRIVCRQVLGQPRRQLVHRRHVLHARGLPLPGPQRHLALHVALRSAETLESDGAPIHPVQRRQHPGQVLVHGSAVGRRLLTHHPVREDPARHMTHYEKCCAEHGFVVAQKLHARYRHVGVGQRSHHPVLPLDLVGPWQQLAGRLLAQHVLPAGNAQMKRGIALTALKLPNFQLTVEAWQSSAQVPGQCGFVEAMRRQYRYQLCHPRHLRPLVVDCVGENPTEERKPVGSLD